MNGTNRSHARGTGKQLPVKGERKNITELTAIAPIKRGNYPKERLPNEYMQTIFEDMKEAMEKVMGKKLPPLKFGKNLTALCNQMVDKFFKEVPPPLVAEKQIDEFVKNSNIPKKHAPTIKIIFQQSESQLLQSPREMTWLEHLKRVGNRAHEKRQEAIRKMSTIHYARWFIVDKDDLPGLDGPHLVFTSNYDGELAGYLEDFANVDEGPLNLVFGHCMEWPGARPVDGFIHYVKEHEHPALIFYANYPSATVGEVRRALDWKNKTQKFIEKNAPKLLNGTSAKSAATLRKSLSLYLKELAKPTSKSEAEPGATLAISRN